LGDISLELRTKAILKILLGGGIFSLVGYLLSHPEAFPFGYMPAGIGVFIMGISFLNAVTGIVEIIAKRPFSEIEDAWSKTTGFKKFLLRIAKYIGAGAFALAIIIFLLYR
jgi:hypothetical protein